MLPLLNPNLPDPSKFGQFWHNEIFAFDKNLIDIHEHNLYMICIFVFSFAFKLNKV